MAVGDNKTITGKDAAGTSFGTDARETSEGDHRQVVALGNAGDTVVGVEPFGALQVNTGFTLLFYDAWSAALDTADKWTTSATAPTIAAGNMTMPTAAGYHSLRTKDVIRAGAGWTYVANGVTLESAAAAGAGRFWGLGVPATTPTATSLAQDGIGFEVDQGTGALHAVTYTGGVRTIVATFTPGSAPTGTAANPSATVPNFRDGQPHRIAFFFRVTGASWYIDGLNVPLATMQWPNVTVVELPALIVRQNATAAPAGVVFVNTAHLTADTSPTPSTIVDPVVGTRAMRVDAQGAAMVRIEALTQGTVVNVPSSATVVTLLASDVNRRRAKIYNNSTQVLFVAEGANATTALATVAVEPKALWETDFDGLITGIWAAANGGAWVSAQT